MSEKRESTFSASELKYILDVNQKAIEIYVEVEKQNDQVLKALDYIKEVSEKFDEQLDTIHQSEAKIEELLKDDNNHDHVVIMDMLKTVTTKITELSDQVKDISTDLANNKLAIDTLAKQIDTDVKSKVSEIDKNLFRLIIFLTGTGVAAIIQYYTHK